LTPRRGEVYWLDWNPARGSEQSGRRPAVVVQNDPFNANPRYPNTVVVTVSRQGLPIPTHVALEPGGSNGLKTKSFIKCEQLLTVSKDRLVEKIGALSATELASVVQALKRLLVLP